MNTYQTSTVLAHHPAYFRIVGTITVSDRGWCVVSGNKHDVWLTVESLDGGSHNIYVPASWVTQYGNRPGLVLEFEGKIESRDGMYRLVADGVAVIISDDDVHTPASDTAPPAVEEVMGHPDAVIFNPPHRTRGIRYPDA